MRVIRWYPCLLVLSLAGCADNNAPDQAEAASLVGRDEWIYAAPDTSFVELRRILVQGQVIPNGCRISGSSSPAPGERSLSLMTIAKNPRTCEWIKAEGYFRDVPALAP